VADKDLAWKSSERSLAWFRCVLLLKGAIKTISSPHPRPESLKNEILFIRSASDIVDHSSQKMHGRKEREQSKNTKGIVGSYS